MAAHQYWRAVAMEAYGATDLELSCFHLLDATGTRVDAPATLTANSAPVTGSVTNLQDDDLSTAARWPVQSVSRLALDWDFGGSQVDVSDIRLAGSSEVCFPLIVRLQWSDNHIEWTESFVFSGITWPGAAVKTASPIVTTLRMLLHHDGADASTVWTDAVGNTVVSNGTIAVSTAQSKFGGASTKYVGTTGELVVTFADPITGSFTVGQWFYWDGTLGNNAVFTLRSGSNLLEVYFSQTSNFYLWATGSASIITAASGPSINTWHLAVLEREKNGRYVLTLNGIVMGSVFGSASATWPITGIILGAYLPGTERLKGYLDETAIYSGYPLFGGSAFTLPTKLFSDVPIKVLRNQVEGRVVPTDTVIVGTGPTIIYGIPHLSEPVNLTVQSGSIRDYVTGVLGTGRGRVSGTVKDTPATPVKRKVRLIRERDGLLIREVFSHPVTGGYSFDYIDELQKFTVISYDHTGAYNGVIAAGVVPELIP